MKKIKVLSFLAASIILYECTTKRNVPDKGEVFVSFYHRFHKDSAFQISRIRFPLPGINSEAMEVGDTVYYWQKKDWVLSHLVDTTLFKRKISLSDSVAMEEITNQYPDLLIKRKFQRINGDWYLVYYESTI